MPLRQFTIRHLLLAMLFAAAVAWIIATLARTNPIDQREPIIFRNLDDGLPARELDPAIGRPKELP